jgi:NAD(P)-dependent dehydrogenase (short-subunit alcohol dehydrogenase family)
MDRLTGKTALITGAGSGMGRSCLRIFAQEGARVLGLGRRLQLLEEARSTTYGAAGAAEVMRADISVEADLDAAVSRALEIYGRIDVVVNAAGLGGNSYRMARPGGMDSLAETPKELWAELMRSNLDAVYYLCKRVIPIMREHGGGSIINVSSNSATKALPSAHAYAATKAAVQSLTRSMAVRYGPEGIRSNCVSPGVTETPMMEGSPVIDLLRSQSPDRFSLVPMGRPGSPDDIAYACLFLASDEASYVNGVVLPVDGGLLSCPA